MSSSPPSTPESIGPYPVERELGRGGMGVVYLARDPKLGRQVAIKVLPAAFCQDPMRLQRFEREARTLAALSHRNVGMIFGLESDELEQRLLVLEFIPGVALTSKLVRGGLPVDEAVRLSLQIAEGLEAAHELGIVHRDLKPDNVRVTPDGIAKILDFGLASAKPPTDAFGTDQAATATGSMLTVEGMVMGTPGYMSPEQARGQTTDRRTDVWAFGCVLFEMLSGYKAFGGETVTDIIAAILQRDPDFSLLPARTPNRLRDLIRKCVVKDARRRLRDIGDARIELEDVLSQPQSGWYKPAEAGGGRPRSVARLVLPLHAPAGPGNAPALDLTIANTTRCSLAISPDGAAVAFVAGTAPLTQLFLRRMDAHEARPVPGAAGAEAPFFSPDGSRLGFFQAGKLMRVSLSGGAPVPLGAAPRPQGACWDETDTIYFIPDRQKPLFRIPGGGGTPEIVVQPDLAAGELALLAPEVLPGSRHALIVVWTGSGYDDALITAIDLRSGQRKPLVHGGCNPRFVPSGNGGAGHIVFSRASQLLAVAFDPDRLEIFGQPMPVQDGVMGNALGGASQFAAGSDGTLVFAPGSVWQPAAAVMSISRTGEAAELIAEKRAFESPAISPDGKRLAVEVQDASTQIWLYDLERAAQPATAGAPGAGVRVTFHADNTSPVWSADGKHIAFRSNMAGRPEVYHVAVDAGGAAGSPELLFNPEDRSAIPTCFADLPGGAGHMLVFALARPAPKGGTEIWMVPADGSTKATPVVQPTTSAWGGRVSPDGRLIAYVSDETGRPEVYVQQFPGPGARRQVSSDGGAAPVWARGGGELFYRTGEQVIAVRVALEPSFMVGRPRPQPLGEFVPPTASSPNFDVFPDGQRFLALRAIENQSRVSDLAVVLNWFEELRRRVPVPERAPPTPSSLGSMIHSRFDMSADELRPSGVGTPTSPAPVSPVPARPAQPAGAGPAINTQMPTIMPAGPRTPPPNP